MKSKRNLFAVAMVLLLMLTAVGYSAWSDTLNVNGSATTGKFNVEFTADSTNQSTGAEGTIGVAIDSTKQTATVTLANVKPKEVYTALLTAENLGTVQAQLTKNVQTGFTSDIYDIKLYSGSTNQSPVLASGALTGHTALTATGKDGSSENFLIEVTVKDIDDTTALETLTKPFSITFTYAQVK